MAIRVFARAYGGPLDLLPSSAIEQATAAINNYRFSELAQSLYHFFWTTYATGILKSPSRAGMQATPPFNRFFFHCLETTLKLLHPLMPFLTEESGATAGTKVDADFRTMARAMPPRRRP